MHVTSRTLPVIRSFSIASFVGGTPFLALGVTREFSTTRIDSKSQKLWLERQHRDPYVKAAGRLNYRARSAFKLLEIDDKFGVFAPGQIILDCGAAPGSWSQVAVQRLRGPPRFKAHSVRQLVTNHKNPVGFEESEIADFRSKPESGLVVGFDLAAIVPLPGAAFLSQADIFDSSTRDRIAQVLHQHQKLLHHFQAGDDDSKSEGDAEPVFGESDAAAPSTLSPCVDVVMSDMAPNCTGHSAHDHDNICRLARRAYGLAAEFLKAEGTFLFKLFDGSSTSRIVDQLKARFVTVRIFIPEGSRTNSSELFVVARGFRPPERK